MKGLRRFIAPFAPDQSGAASVLCRMGGMILILDAGGCAGNICGFDEPRWFGYRSAIFSAGLRDMDAILGRDALLVEKVEKACRRIRARFIALIGTPVPAVIATDYRALKRMIEKKTGLPVLTIETDGTGLYDEGAGKAWLALTEAVIEASDRDSLNRTKPEFPSVRAGEGGRERRYSGTCALQTDISGPVGIFGLSPLERGNYREDEDIPGLIRELLPGASPAHCYGEEDEEEILTGCREHKLNLAAAPSALPAVRRLEEVWGTPWRVWCPVELIPQGRNLSDRMKREPDRILASGRRLGEVKNILIVHQQFYANSLREQLEAGLRDGKESGIRVASWFLMEKEWMREGDVHLREEDQWIRLVRDGDYDLIVCDPALKRPLSDVKADWWQLPHFAV